MGEINDHRRAGGELVDMRARRTRPPGGDGELIDTSAPFEVAKTFLGSRFDDQEVADLRFWQGDFWISSGPRYVHHPNEALRAELYPWLEQRRTPKRKPIKPNKHMVDKVLDALKAAAHLGGVSSAPAWIDGAEARYPPAELIVCRNGLLHVPTRTLLPSSRKLFTLNALDYDYDPDAPAPAAWLEFLRELWGEDQETIDTLQEMFGLALTADTSFQKAFLLVGPKRSGKGTIARVLRQLVGAGNVVAPMLASLGQQFGLESMIAKTLAIVSDMRLSGRADIPAIVENILRITGEDAVSIPRKFRVDWTAPLQARFIILSNELPALMDQSGALASRFVLLRFVRTFFGAEDLQLTPRLLLELPGILLWALDGLARLRERGHFGQPESARKMVQQLELLSSPIKAFVTDRCVVVPGAEIECSVLFDDWTKWVNEQGRDHAGSVQMFGRNLAAAYPGVEVVLHRAGGYRGRYYSGIRLRTMMDPEPDEGSDAPA